MTGPESPPPTQHVEHPIIAGPIHRAFVAEVRREKLDEYRRLHAAPWPEIQALLRRAKLEDYRIWLDGVRGLLFSSWTYRGTDLEADLARLRAHPVASAWHAETLACLVPIGDGIDAWQAIDQIFDLDPSAAIAMPPHH